MSTDHDGPGHPDGRHPTATPERDLAAVLGRLRGGDPALPAVPTVRAASVQPHPVVPVVWQLDLEWEVDAGTGAVYSWSVVWRPQSPAFHVPYAPAIIEVDEGYQMLSCIIGCGPDAIEVGLRVGVEFHPAGGGISLPYFRPLSSGLD